MHNILRISCDLILVTLVLSLIMSSLQSSAFKTGLSSSLKLSAKNMATSISTPSISVSEIPTISTQKNTTIVWFRDNLRVHDNYVLHEALQNHISSNISNSNQFLCIYCFDPRHFNTTKYGSRKTDVYRGKFLLESVENLRSNLKRIGSGLYVAFDRPENTLASIISRKDQVVGSREETTVYVQKEVTSEEIHVENRVDKRMNELGARLVRIDGNKNLYHPREVATAFKRNNFADMPDLFTTFKEKVEKVCKVASLLPVITELPINALESTILSVDITEDGSVSKAGFDYMPTLNDLGFSDEVIQNAWKEETDQKEVMTFQGGEDQALQRLQKWMFDDDNLKDYFDIRNGMLGERYSSKFSPWLANGCLSPRLVFHEVKRYENIRKISSKSTYWLIFEMIWRDFFYYLGWKYGNEIFKSGGAHRMNKIWNRDSEKIMRWETGTTGQPLVDANMRELKQTGWMSGRGRQNVASYLVLDLGVDWRVGADHFESLLLDHDVTSNYGNWNVAAGLTGGRINRFNIIKQSKDYDPQGEYIKYWIPELRNVPVPFIFEPWLMNVREQERYNIKIGPDGGYPLPIEISTRDYSKPYEKITFHKRPVGDFKPSSTTTSRASKPSTTVPTPTSVPSPSMTPTSAPTSAPTSSQSASKKKSRVQHL